MVRLCDIRLMGQYQRGVHFGAASLKRGEECSKFSVFNFLKNFILTLFLNNSLIF